MSQFLLFSRFYSFIQLVVLSSEKSAVKIQIQPIECPIMQKIPKKKMSLSTPSLSLNFPDIFSKTSPFYLIILTSLINLVIFTSLQSLPILATLIRLLPLFPDYKIYSKGRIANISMRNHPDRQLMHISFLLSCKTNCSFSKAEKKLMIMSITNIISITLEKMRYPSFSILGKAMSKGEVKHEIRRTREIQMSQKTLNLSWG